MGISMSVLIDKISEELARETEPHLKALIVEAMSRIGARPEMFPKLKRIKIILSDSEEELTIEFEMKGPFKKDESLCS